MSDASEHTDDSTDLQTLDPADVLAESIRDRVTPDDGQTAHEAALTERWAEYQCIHCEERCLNPERSLLAENDTCLTCHVSFAVNGHRRDRISFRWAHTTASDGSHQ